MTQTTDSAPDGAVTAAAELGRRTADTVAIRPEELTPGALVGRVLSEGEKLAIADLGVLADAPRRTTGNANLHRPADFANYVNRLADPDTATIWADERTCRCVCVFNDHTKAAAGWRDHTAALTLRTDPDWAAWQQKDGALLHQVEFAEFLEQQAAVIVEPDAADMLELATSFHAHRTATFDGGVRLANGDQQLKYTEQTTGAAGVKGTMEVPTKFTVRLAPFVGVAPVDMTARLRWRIRDAFRIGYVLHRPDQVRSDAFNAIAVQIDETTEVPVLFGSDPASTAGDDEIRVTLHS